MKQLFLLLFFMAIACKSQSGTGSAPQAELKWVMNDYYYSGDPASLQIIREAGALKKFFMKVNQTRKPGIPVPDIDFTKELVILYTGGEASSDATPSLHLLQETPTQLVLGSKTAKETSQLQSQAPGTTFQLYTIPITEKEILLEEGRE